ncbi:poly(A) RNA polymerase, mitochondrial-like [Neocloeon triangulifer]|uniref:poly(A) RNA polymerase, mitochondrial-like n=1 Tax=Neocloeon triangulifer TaxID=2078957 RepID=UPI00286EE51C|nr:poly(A) RNA polymerase, mitochondrial-like [Neocloeon triangulifer]
MALRMLKLFSFRAVSPKGRLVGYQVESYKGLMRIPVRSRHCMSFNDMLEFRREQAQKSVVIQVYSDHSYNHLTKLCNEYGPIKETLYYTTPTDLHFILVEFEKKESARKIMESGSFGQKMPPVPCVSPFLWMRASSIKSSEKDDVCPKPVQDSEAKKEILLQNLHEAQSFSDQIKSLYNLTAMGELGIRLRFLTSRQLELALSGAFPFCKALPFGSSVNGFGKAGCDLDLVLQLGGMEEGQETKTEGARLVYHNKNSQSSNGRALVQRHMEVLADFMQHFLPGFSNIQRILHARVPIIKSKHNLTLIECDISMTNMTALHMSEFLYLMGEIDNRVRPLVFVIKRWAQATGLTNPTPGRWVSNFSLTLLTLFYLQKKEVLPSLGTLIRLAGPNDKRFTAEGVNCSFLRDLSNLALSKNKDDLETLLKGFFEFYSTFDYGSRGLSLVTGNEIPKADHSPLFIENPLERYLNVSKNISMEETVRLKVELQNALWITEQALEEVTSVKKDLKWGLIKLLAGPNSAAFKMPKPKTFRLVEMQDLFAEDSSVSHPQPLVKVKGSNKVNHKRR